MNIYDIILLIGMCAIVIISIVCSTYLLVNNHIISGAILIIYSLLISSNIKITCNIISEDKGEK